MKFDTFDEALAVHGRRVRYVQEGKGDTNRVDTTTFEMIRAPYRVVIEGEVRGVQMVAGFAGMGRVWLYIAGWGDVNTDGCELLKERRWRFSWPWK